MIDSVSLAAGCVLIAAVVVGLLAHEGAHALALRASGIEYEVVLVPGRSNGLLAGLAGCPWAAVYPNPTGDEPSWQLRVAALMPLVLALPGFAFFAVPTENVLLTAWAIGWLACAIPSPQDFSVAFYAPRLLEAAATGDEQPPTCEPGSRWPVGADR